MRKYSSHENFKLKCVLRVRPTKRLTVFYPKFSRELPIGYFYLLVSHRTACIAIVVIDVVEGTAIDALPAMEALLRGRPSKFKSKAAAVEWATKTGYIKNLISAKISMPSQVQDSGETFISNTSLVEGQISSENISQPSNVQKWVTTLILAYKDNTNEK